MSAYPPRLAAYIQFFETLTEESLSDLSGVFTEDVHFRDPFNDVHTRTELERAFRAMFASCHDIHFEVEDAAGDEERAFLLWRMRFRMRSRFARQEPWLIEGSSRVLFAADGRVCEHIDYWDAAGSLYERIPVLGTVLRALRKRIG